MKKKFWLRFNVEVCLEQDDIWVDNDAPVDPTSVDVERVIEACGGWIKIIEDWNLIDRHVQGTVEEVQSEKVGT